jgi:hypothetical protein
MLSMGIAALVIAVTVGAVEITPAQYPAFLVAFRRGLLIFSALCAAGIVASLARGKVHAPAPRTGAQEGSGDAG